MTDQFTGTDTNGVEYLLTIFDDGTHELAIREGDGRWGRWGVPIALTPEPAEVTG